MTLRWLPCKNKTFNAVLAVIILGSLGGVSYYVWHSKQASDKTPTVAAISSQQPTTITKPPSSPTTIDPEKARIVDYKNGSIYSLQFLATGDAQTQQIGAIGRFCNNITPDDKKDGSIVVTTNPAIFTQVSDDYHYDAATQSATISASCYNEAASQTVPAPLQFKLQKQAGVWNTTNYDANQRAINQS